MPQRMDTSVQLRGPARDVISLREAQFQPAPEHIIGASPRRIENFRGFGTNTFCPKGA